MSCGSTPKEGSAEYGKEYKPQNNAGCCCGCRSQTTTTTANSSIRRGCFVRYKIFSNRTRQSF